MTEPKTTPEAFKELLYNPEMWKTNGYKYQRILQIRYRFKQGKISHEMMCEMLSKFGYKVEQEELWVKF